MTRIRQVHAREVLDSRGLPTVEVELSSVDGQRASAIVPAGASTGKAEALELRDGDPQHFDGRGVRRAVENVRKVLGPAVVGLDPADQAAIDARLCDLDGTPNKCRLGGNAILGVSLAAAHLAAAAANVPLYRHLNQLWRQTLADLPAKQAAAFTEPRMPLPMTNMISGGLHAGGQLEFQDFLVMPHAAPSYAVGLEWIVRITRRLAKLLIDAGYEGRLVADEGGYGPRLPSNRLAVEFVVRAIESAGLTPGGQVTIALDVASSHFYRDGHYRMAATGDAQLTSSQMIDELEQLVDEFPITSIEDGLAEDDWTGWQELTSRLSDRTRLVGDDLFATRADRLQRGIDSGVANSVLVKFNQVGTLTETLATMRLAVAAGYTRVASARSGETEDTTLADLAVGASADLIKIGAIQRGERLAKYNRLLRIEEEIQGS